MSYSSPMRRGALRATEETHRLDVQEMASRPVIGRSRSLATWYLTHPVSRFVPMEASIPAQTGRV